MREAITMASKNTAEEEKKKGKQQTQAVPFAELSLAVTGRVLSVEELTTDSRLLYLFDEYFSSRQAQVAYKLPVVRDQAQALMTLFSENKSLCCQLVDHTAVEGRD